MDQIKPVLEQIKKHHFWILTGVVVLLCIVFGYLGTSDISQKWHARESQIKSAFSTAQQVASVQHHPNDAVAQEMEKINRQLAEEVFKAWQERFARQEAMLVWPAELKADFISKVKVLQPIEATVPYPEKNAPLLKKPLRSRYRNYIHNELPKLAERIKAKWSAGTTPSSGGPGGGPGGPAGPGGGMGPGGPGGGMSGMGGRGGMDDGEEAVAASDDPGYVVEWDSGNQGELLSRFDWSKNPDGVPTVLQILYAQEDLWILTGIMDIIAQTNGDADAQYNAAVKVIDSIQLGAQAGGIADGGEVMLFDTGGGSSGYGMSGMGGSSSGGSAGAGSAGMSNMYSQNKQEASGPDPADNRYVDAKYAPVKGQQLRSAFSSTSPDDAFLVVAKRMPVRMVLKVDVLKLPRLLAMCGNADLTFEVRQVRINPQSKTQIGGSGGGGGFAAGGGPAGMGTSMGDMSGSGGAPSNEDEDSGYGAMGGGGLALESIESPYDVEVEIYGLIYLYNPPQRSKLGLPEDGKAEQAPAAANPAAGAPAGG